MAQTKKKRRSKHRGNAAGMIESRGRTGRKPTADERKADAREETRRKREERMFRPPTWRSSFNRALVATALFGVLVVLLFGRSVGQALALSAVMLVLYIPLGYYTDSLIWRRRQRKLGQPGQKPPR